jgi:hypothetical protein
MLVVSFIILSEKDSKNMKLISVRSRNPRPGIVNKITSRSLPVPALFLLVGVIFTAPLFALASAPAVKTKALAGHVPDAIHALKPAGKLPQTNRLNLAIGLPLRDPQALEAFLKQLYNPNSPSYRQYLTPDQFAARFSPTTADYERVAAFAKTHHLTITARHKNRLLLDVNASVGDIESAFHLNLNTYAHPTQARNFYAPDAEPIIDAALPVADISGLNNFVVPHPRFVQTGAAPSVAPTPRTGSGSGGAYLGNDFRAAYLPGVSLVGSGQTVGVFEFDGFFANDIFTYETLAGISPVPVQTVLLDGFDGTPTSGANSGNPEVSLDIEMAIAIAPGLSKVVSFEAGPNGIQNDVLSAMASSNQIKQFSCSWGWGGGPSATTDNIFKQMAAQGQSFFTASGDTDAYTTGASSINGVDNPLLPNAPSSCPYITTVGGTALSTSGPGGAWSAESAWNSGQQSAGYTGTSGGISCYYSIPAWQTGVASTANGGSKSFRNIPDVAMVADNVFVEYGNGSSGPFGGTSCAAPLWAGLAALMNQQAAASGQPAVGFINPAIYSLGNGSGFSSSFHDIVGGNNTWASSPNQFYAVSGFDLCTGWGTPSGQNIIDALTGPPDSLQLAPAFGFTAQGPVGGPFSPYSQTLILSNSSSAPLTWSVANTPALLAVSPTNGQIAAQSTATIETTLNATAAASLSAGVYSADLTISNLTTHAAHTEQFNVEVGQSIVQNGGFETGDFTGWTLTGNTVVNTGRFGQTVYNAVENTSAGYQVVHSGAYGAFLGDNQLATLSQTLPTAPGRIYLLGLWLDNPTAGSLQQFLVKWNGGVLYGVTNPPAFGWKNLQFLVTSSNTNSTLQFASENDPSYFGVDDVTVVPIQAPVFQNAIITPGGLSLSWQAAAGLTCQLQFKTDLLQSNWTNLGAPVIPSGNSVTITDSAASGSPQRFYRLVLSP